MAAVKELYRVTKYDGYVFVALMSRVRKLQTVLMYPEMWRPLDNMESISKFKEDGVFNHQDEGRFTGGYYYPIADIKPFMESNGFETVDLIGSNGIGGRLTEANWEYWRNRGDDEFNKLMEIIYHTHREDALFKRGKELRGR